MSTQETTEPCPFTRPGFIAAAVVIALLVVLGIVVAITNATGDRIPAASPASSPSGAPAPESGADAPASEASVCGLAAADTGTTLPVAPDATWQYQGTTAYPTSTQYGPGATAEAGYRYCFAHSPAGAVFMAANAVTQGGSDNPALGEWVDYALAEGPYRAELLATMSSTMGAEGTRMSVAGFRLLHYDGVSARVDLAVRASVQGQTLTASGVYELVWADGDWKFSADVAQPLDIATVPDFSGYVIWGE